MGGHKGNVWIWSLGLPASGGGAPPHGGYRGHLYDLKIYLQILVLKPLKQELAATVYAPKFSTYTHSPIANSGKRMFSQIKSMLSHVGPNRRLLCNFPSLSLNGKITG